MTARGRIRKIILWVHLALGLSAGLILIVIGLTGAALAFRDDYGRWVNRAYFSVEASGEPMSQDAIVAKVETEYAPSRVESINFIWPDEYLYYFMNDRGPLIVNTIDGRILDPRAGEAWTSKLVIKANELHTKLALGDAGRFARDIATYEVLLLIPTGVFLWWRSKRFGIKWKGSWYKRFWDLHSTIGIVIVLPIFFLAFTGSLIALRLPESRVAAEPGTRALMAPVPSIDPAQWAKTPLDAAIAVADAALPDIPTYQVMLPESPWAPYTIQKSPGGWSTRNQRSTVRIHQKTGAVLGIERAQPFTRGFEIYDFGKRIHTGELFGGVGKAIMGIASFLFAVLALTGLGLGALKFYGMWARSKSRRGAGEAA